MEHVISSKTNDAKVFLDRFSLDKGTMGQLRDMVDNPALKHIRVMPDCHKGVGCCVGLTSQLTDKIVPRFIGVDIGCGILTYPVQRLLESFFNSSDLSNTELERIDKIIQDLIPLHEMRKVPVVTDDELTKVCYDSYDQAYEFAKSYQQYMKSELQTSNNEIFKSIPNYSIEWIKEKCQHIGTEYDYFLKSIGDLGGGNHYIEINESTSKNKYITIHSGSRSFGRAICMYHQEKIDSTRRFDYAEYKDRMKQATRKFKNPIDLKAAKDVYINEFNESKHAEYLEGSEAYQYYFDMIFAQNIAKLNRRVMLRIILKAFNIDYSEENVIESIHNYIDFNDMIMRKGAIRSVIDEMCIVYGILICKGKSNKDWNLSAPHGAGRLLERHRASAQLKMSDFVASMKGVYSSCINESTLDESPAAYKDPDMIKKALEPTADIVEELKPILNIKADT
jgi:tRNA-splicing ligase RtcB